AEFEPVSLPVVSLYLNAQPDEHGRDHYNVFTRKEFKARLHTYPLRSPERQSLGYDLDRISTFLETGVRPAVNGVAVFACHQAGLFETVQFELPVERHWLYIGDRPHLYPLARLASKYPPYVVVLADTTMTRIIVVADGQIAASTAVQGRQTHRTDQGALSQTRYQRRVENYHLHHVKDVVDTLERIVLDDHVTRVILSGDVAVLPLLHEQLPKWLAQRVVDELSLPPESPEREVIATTLRSMRKLDERTDRQKVDAAVGAYRAGRLGVVGPDATLLALDNGQVDELLLTGSPEKISRLRRTPASEMAMAIDDAVVRTAVAPAAAGEPAAVDAVTAQLADELVRKAHQTRARVTFIEDGSLLEPFGGVAATLRYRFSL
ncbi:MAG TPA: Vms1/Ankzf1 family peptidyl-tRNA hydrolase, partial [Vicinamibacterales bacterium]